MVCFGDESVIKAKPPVLQPHHHYVFTVQGNEKGKKKQQIIRTNSNSISLSAVAHNKSLISVEARRIL